MKKRIYMMTLVFLVGLCSGCGKQGTESNDQSIKIESFQIEEQADVENKSVHVEEQGDVENESIRVEEQDEDADKTNDGIELDDNLEIDFTYDYSEDIKTDVDYVVSNSRSLQEELKNIEKIIEKYIPLAQAAQSQMEMNISSKWFLVIWDTELNNLWNRFSNSADPQTKEKVLAEQRNWIAMKEEVTLLSLGPAEENGSMYPLNKNAFLEEITKRRAYVLANELAKINGESFVIPETPTKYGLFVDNQGTGDIYGFLITRQGWEGEDEVIISIYRQGETEGSFIDNENGELAFTSVDGSVKGIIRINGWDGASFEVTEISGASAFSVGEMFEFPFVF